MSPMRTGIPAGVVFTTIFAISLRTMRLPAYQAEHQLMIALHHAGRVDHITGAEGIEQSGHGDVGPQQLGRVGTDLEFRLLAALHDNRGDAAQAIQAAA